MDDQDKDIAILTATTTAAVCVGIGMYYLNRVKRLSKVNIISKRKRKPRSEWVKSYLLRRPQYGLFEHLIAELASDYIGDYKNFMRMSPETFNELLDSVGPLIQKKNTVLRDAIPPEQRLCLTLKIFSNRRPLPKSPIFFFNC